MFWANVIITAIRDATGALVGFAKVTRDVTDRRDLLAERERVAAERSEFLAMTAHELRGPIALLQGFSDLLRSSWQELDDEEREDMLDTLVRSSIRLRRLVEDLLTTSRLEAGALDIRPQPVELLPAIRAVVGAVTTDVEISGPEDVRALVDPVRLQQMLDNYVANALRHGEPPIEVTVTKNGRDVDITVIDSGNGVPPADVENLFDKFTHGGHEGSTGLGLYIVRQLARAQGGDAFLQDTSPDGARFVLRLPAG
jgi:signal transduction histidine kinase